MRPKLSIPVWIPLSWAATVLVGAATGVVVHQRESARIEASILDEARRAAVSFPSTALDALDGAASDATSSAYRELKDRLIQARAANAGLRRLDLLRATNARAVALVDSEPVDAASLVRPGSPLDPAAPALATTLATGASAWAPGPGPATVAYAIARERGVGESRDVLRLEWAAGRRDGALAAGVRAGLVAWLLGALPLGVGIFMRRRLSADASPREVARALELGELPAVRIGADDLIQSLNPAASRLLGLAPGEGLDRDWMGLAPEAGAPLRAEIAALLRAGRSWSGPLVLRRKDGSSCPVQAVACPALDDGRKLVSVLLILIDASGEARQRERLAAVEERAAAGDRARAQFLATMSHEVRGPLNGIVGYASLLLETPLTPEQREYAHAIRGSSESLIELTGHVLDQSRLEAGRLEPSLQPCSPVDLVEGVLEAYAMKAAEKGVELLHHVHADIPGQVRLDARLCRQVLSNLVDNALRATAEGHVEVEVETISGSQLSFSVRDTGSGLSMADQETVRQRLMPATDAPREGGLPVSRQIAAALGGGITFESTLGAGSHFRLTVRASPVEGFTSAPPVALTGRRIGICTRHPGLRNELNRLVAGWGAEAVPGSLEHLPEADVALVDCDEDAIRRLNHLSADEPTWRSLKPVGLAPVTLSSEIRQVVRPRFSALLNKPLRHEALRAAVAGLLVGGGSSDTRTPFSSLKLRVLVVEDNRVAQQLLQRILESLGCTWTVAANGKRALEELAVEDFDLVLMDLHMPEMDGIEATRIIRAGEAGPIAREVWITAVTADARPEQRERAFAAGVNDYVQKPVTRSDIEAALRRYRSERRMMPR